MTAVSVYKGTILLGTAEATFGSDTLTSYEGAPVGEGRNVMVTALDGAEAGQSVQQRVVADNLTSLVLGSTFDLA